MRTIGLKSLIIVAFAVSHAFAHAVSAQDAPDVSELALPGGPVQTTATPNIFGLAGDVQVVVQLVDAPLAAAQGRNAKKAGGRLGPAQQRTYLAQLDQEQDALLAQIRNLGGRDAGRLN